MNAAIHAHMRACEVGDVYNRDLQTYSFSFLLTIQIGVKLASLEPTAWVTHMIPQQSVCYVPRMLYALEGGNWGLSQDTGDMI